VRELFLLQSAAVVPGQVGRSFVKYLNRLQPLSLLILRIVLGIIFMSHGYPKIAHASGNMQAFFIEHGLPGYFVHVSAILETFGGGLLLLGLFTRPAALLLAIEMCVAIWKVHSGHGYLAVHDYEFPLTLAAACLVLASVGAGLISIDHPLFEGREGKSRSSHSSKD
jgi:putative oxidoreductase